MIKIEQSVMVSRPIEEVFAFMSDFENDPQWRRAVQELKAISPGPRGANTEYRQVAKFLGQRIESSFKIVEFEQNRKLAFKTTGGPVESTGGYLFESVPGGTKVTNFSNTDMGGIFKIAEPLVGRQYKKQVSNDLEELQKVLGAGR